MPRRLRRCRYTLAVALLGVILLAAAGCAGGTTTTTSPPPTVTGTTPPANPVIVLSVTGPMPPFNPGGPVVEITVENTSDVPVVSLNATLELERSYKFDFGLGAAGPLAPGTTASASLTLINGSISSQDTYPLTVSGTLANGQDFTFAEQVVIAVLAT